MLKIHIRWMLLEPQFTDEEIGSERIQLVGCDGFLLGLWGPLLAFLLAALCDHYIQKSAGNLIAEVNYLYKPIFAYL